MPYTSTGDFLLRATPEDMKKMTSILKSIQAGTAPILTGVVSSISMLDTQALLQQTDRIRR
jgi:hypothetical protein